MLLIEQLTNPLEHDNWWKKVLSHTFTFTRKMEVVGFAQRATRLKSKLAKVDCSPR
jgi:hypothetical protein